MAIIFKNINLDNLRAEKPVSIQKEKKKLFAINLENLRIDLKPKKLVYRTKTNK